MPAFTVPAAQRLREFNQCHNPEGAGGGRFCSGDSGIYLQQVSKSIYKVIDTERGIPIRWKGPKGMRDTYTRREAEKIATVWGKRKQRDVGSFYKSSDPGREEFEDLLGWMNGVVGG